MEQSRGSSVVALDQQIGEDIRVDDEHLLIATPGNRRFNFFCGQRTAAQLNGLRQFPARRLRRSDPFADQLGDRVFQLTYESNVGFVYDRATFEPKGSFRYASQGWGLTTDGTRLIMSNGSAALIFIDPTTMETTGYVVVSRDEGPVGFLNELEYIDGKVFANIWQTDLIVVASPETGKVLAWIDLTGLNPEPDRLRYPFVLNGIARDPVDGRLVVTGKTWPRLYAIDLIPLKNAQPLRPGTLP